MAFVQTSAMTIGCHRLGAAARRALVTGLVAVAPLLAAPLPSHASPSDPKCRDLANQAARAIDDAEKTHNPARALDAVALAEAGIRLCPDDPTLRFYLAYALIDAGEEDRARTALIALDQALVTEARASNPNRAPNIENEPRSLFVQALLAFTFGNNPSMTLERIGRLRNRSQDFLPGKVATLEFKSRLAYGAQLRHIGEYVDAEKQFQLAIIVAGDNVSMRDIVRRNLGQLLREASRFNESEEVFRDLVARYPRDAVLRYALASVLADQARFDEACTVWKEVLKLRDESDTVDPAEKDQLADVRMRLGVSLAQALRVKEGREELRRYVEERPDDAPGWLHLGRLAFKHQTPPDFAEAVRCLEKAFALDPVCELAAGELIQIYSTARPDPERAAFFKEFLSEENKKKRARLREKRKETRPDHTVGCE